MPLFLTARDQKIEPPAPDTPPNLAALSGTWRGKLQADGLSSAAAQQEVGIVVETVTAEKASLVYQLGAGPERMMNMQAVRHEAKWEGDRFIYRSTSSKFSVAVLPPKDDVLRLIVTGTSGKVFDMTLRQEAAP